MMTTSEPIPFNGKDIFTFSLDHEIAIVGENAAKPAGGATMTPVQIRPVKVVYQSRVSDEFMLAAQEAQLDTLRAFVDGFSAKVARGLDIMAMHGVNPFDGNASSIVGNNHFDYAIPEANKIVYGHDSSAADANIEEALGKIESPTGIIMGKTIRTAVAELTTNNARKYPRFRVGRDAAHARRHEARQQLHRGVQCQQGPRHRRRLLRFPLGLCQGNADGDH